MLHIKNKTAIAKKVVRIIVQFGAGTVVHAIISNNVDTTDASVAHKVSVPVASYALGGMVANAAGDYTDKLIDEMVALLKDEDGDVNVVTSII